MNKISKTILGASISTWSLLSTGAQALADDATGLNQYVKVPKGFFFDDAKELVGTVLRGVMMLAGLLVFAYLVWGGIEWITSGGDKGKTENARNKITAAIIGLVILAASWAILQIVLTLLGVSGYQEIFVPPTK